MTLATSERLENRARAAARVSGSSFYLAMRILGREQREAMFEIYAFCRAVDDIADSGAPRNWRLDRLAEWREDIEKLYAGAPSEELDGLASAVGRFALRKDDFLAVIDGMEMDAAADLRAPDLATLDLYCDRVASAVGRLSVRVFGMDERDGAALAHHLGRALQLTNILRDVDEDAAAGRLYIPAEMLRTAEVKIEEPARVVAQPRFGEACTPVAELARSHFIRADAIMARVPHRLVRAPLIMSEVYRQMLEDMTARGWDFPRSRVHVGKAHLLWIALRHAFV